jgi:type I restriction enzyme S subunit
VSKLVTSTGIPASWTVVPLKELGDWSGGGTPSKAKSLYWHGGTIPWVSPKDMKTERISDSEDHITKEAVSNSTASLINANSVLIVTRSGILRHTLPVAVNSVPVTVNQDLKALTPRNGIMAEYVAWALRAFSRDILNACSKQGTTVNSVETGRLLSFEIPVAPIEQQQHIVAEIEKQFSRLDEAVANLKRVKANLKRYKAAVLKAAIEGKLTEDWRKQHPEVEPASKLLERILANRRAKWKGKGRYKEPLEPDTTNLAPLPDGWVWCITDALFSYVTSGSRGWAQHYSVEGPLFIRIGNLDHDSVRLDLEDIHRVKPPEGAEGTRTKVEEGDILVSITADVGMIAVTPLSLGEAYINQHVALARPILGICREYLAWYLASRDGGQKHFRRLQRGATKVGLGLDDIRAVPVPLPPLAEQQSIVAEVERRLSVIEELEAAVQANLTRADRLRQSILATAFAGKLVTTNPARMIRRGTDIKMARSLQ